MGRYDVSGNFMGVIPWKSRCSNQRSIRVCGRGSESLHYYARDHVLLVWNFKNRRTSRSHRIPDTKDAASHPVFISKYPQKSSGSGIHIHKYDRKYAGAWLGSDSCRTKSNGSTGTAGGRAWKHGICKAGICAQSQ